MWGETGGNSARQPALDGLRGLAVAGVLLFHAGFGWAGGGFLGVSIFFTLLIAGLIVYFMARYRRQHPEEVGTDEAVAVWLEIAWSAIPLAIALAGAAAGLPHIHPHQLRHTLATQAINRAMSLEAIAAMLGHRSLDMTLRYAKIANRTVADEYFAATDKVDALYARTDPLPADAIGPKMAQLRREHHRLLGNGHCTRPPELGCAFESICETCTFFQTSIEFRPTLQAQHDDAKAKSQERRAALFNKLLTNLTEGEAS